MVSIVALLVDVVITVALVLIAVFVINKTVTDPQANQLVKFLVFIIAVLWFVSVAFGLRY